MKKEKNNKKIKENKAEKVEGFAEQTVETEAVEDKKVKNKNKKDKNKSGGASFLVLKIVIAITLVLVIFYFGFTCTVREGNAAIITRFGKPRETITEAGLHLKLPWPFESVITYDNREQYYETTYTESLTKSLTKDSKNIAFKFYVVWKIDDPLKYHIATTQNGTSIDVNNVIETSARNAIATTIGKYELSDIVSSSNENLKIDQFQSEIYQKIKASCGSTYSMNIVDVKILRISYPDENIDAIVNNIAIERENYAKFIESQGEQEAQSIKNSAGEEVARIEGSAKAEYNELIKAAESEVASIYAAAQEANIELYKFLKELDTIVNSVNSNSVLIVDSTAYPFNILLDYNKTIGNDTDVVEDLEYILSKLPDDDRAALVTAIEDLIEAAANNSSSNTDTPETPDAGVEEN